MPYSPINDDNYIISDCLNDLGFNQLANLTRTIHNGQLLSELVKMIESAAASRRDSSVLERLYFAGLSYGVTSQQIQGGI